MRTANTTATAGSNCQTTKYTEEFQWVLRSAVGQALNCPGIEVVPYPQEYCDDAIRAGMDLHLPTSVAVAVFAVYMGTTAKSGPNADREMVRDYDAVAGHCFQALDDYQGTGELERILDGFVLRMAQLAMNRSGVDGGTRRENEVRPRSESGISPEERWRLGCEKVLKKWEEAYRRVLANAPYEDYSDRHPWKARALPQLSLKHKNLLPWLNSRCASCGEISATQFMMYKGDALICTGCRLKEEWAAVKAALLQAVATGEIKAEHLAACAKQNTVSVRATHIESVEQLADSVHHEEGGHHQNGAQRPDAARQAPP